MEIAVIGLGYVGLPLAVEFGKRHPTVGFDLIETRVAALREGVDQTGEVSRDELRAARLLTCTTDPNALARADVLIIAVPTPVDSAHQPEFGPLAGASRTAGKHMKRGAIVVYESTVYPGATEEVCVPILEQQSGMTWKKDFFVGYSPERINPGDKQHRLTSITKVVAGDTPATLETLAKLYADVVQAGVHRATSIKVAEAAKVIENTQRDVNIALVNELAMIFERVGIDTEEVLEAAGTKWNFLPFRPGLVGGHCIGVDPYYLTYKAQQLGYNPEMILAGRRINDNMSIYIASRIIKLMLSNGLQPLKSRVLVLGLTFKENCPDVRNTKVIDIVRELKTYGSVVDVHDPWVDAEIAREEYRIDMAADPEKGAYDVVVLAVAHREFRAMGSKGIRHFGKPGSVVYDIKYLLPSDQADDRL